MKDSPFIPLQIQGARCLDAFCRHHHLNHPAISALITHLLSIASATDLPAWEQAGQLLPLNGRGDPWPTDLDAAIPEHLRADFHRLVDHTVEISLSDYYGATTSRPPEFYVSCLHLLKKHAVPVPE